MGSPRGWPAQAAEPGPSTPLPLLTVGKVTADMLLAVELTREEWRDNRALCTYCQVATLASAASLVLALPEARRALRALYCR